MLDFIGMVITARPRLVRARSAGPGSTGRHRTSTLEAQRNMSDAKLASYATLSAITTSTLRLVKGWNG
jgi:hypothetical protein